ncbi:MAG: redoxin family protein [Pyrinomonadaceae bacterium]
MRAFEQSNRISSRAKRIAFICASIGVCAAVAFFFYSRARGRTTTRERTYEEFSSIASARFQQMPAEVTKANLETLDGASLQLSSRAGKVVGLDLWATWCGPCRKEIPHLVQLSKDYKDRDVEVIGLTTENPAEAAKKVRDFRDEFKIDYTLGWARDVAPHLMQGNTSIPQKFVITRDGRLMKRLIGFNTQTGPAQLREAVEQALNLGNEAQVSSAVKPAAQAVPSDSGRRISPEDLHSAVTKGEAVILDVRPEAQYKSGHIKGTLWIPDNEISTRFNELPRDKLIATYCS